MENHPATKEKRRKDKRKRFKSRRKRILHAVQKVERKKSFVSGEFKPGDQSGPS